MIDLSTWNLTLPEGSPATVVETSRLAASHSTPYFQATESGVTFWAPVTGGTTKNSKYPRSELRETFSDGTLHNWRYTETDNYLRAALTVQQVPSTGKVVIGQIHTYGDENPMIKLQYRLKDNVGRIEALVRQHPDHDAVASVVAENVPLGQRFTYSIHLTPGGTLSVNAAGNQWSTRIDPAWKEDSMYFKAGVYVQDNTGYTSEGGKATFYKLQAEHRKL